MERQMGQGEERERKRETKRDDTGTVETVAYNH
jgi:hypothetical protein